jgi:diphthine synthase
MGFNLIGLGLGLNSITKEAQKVLENCEKVYLEGYTVNFPYEIDELKKSLGIKVEFLERGPVEDEHLLDEAKETEIALLVYGDSLSATTHTQLILACKKKGIEYKIFHNASIMIAIAQTGLQLYKFGKTPSMPKWQKSFEPTSFLDYYLENQKSKAHTLLLTDIGLDLKSAIEQLEKACEEKECKIEKIIAISNAGLDNQKIYSDTLGNLKEKEVPMPYCLILPGEMHFLEEEALEEFSEKD